MHTFYRACRADFQALQPAVGRLGRAPREFYTSTTGSVLSKAQGTATDLDRATALAECSLPSVSLSSSSLNNNALGMDHALGRVAFSQAQS